MKKQREITPLTECIHGSKITPCNEDCPFGLNVRDMMAKMKKGSFIGAFNIYRDAVLFPEVVCRLCPAPCHKKCEDTLEGKGIDIRALEKFLSDTFAEKDPVNYGGIIESKKIAVIGSNLTGISAALKFGQAGYAVTLFEEGSVLCPEVVNILGEEVLNHGILRQFKYSPCEMKTNADLSSFNPSDFDCVIKTAECGVAGDNVYEPEKAAHPVAGIQAGINIYKQLDWYLKTGNLKELESLNGKAFEGEFKVYDSGLEIDKALARSMANDCTGCDCSKCMDACVMLKDYGNDIIDLNRAIGMTLNLFEHVDTREATRQISGCTDCGLCKELCPKGIDIGAFLIDTKKKLFDQGVIPHAYHDYWLRDYANAESDKSFLFYVPKENPKYMFFPGCQTGASDPRYVSKTYELLLSLDPGTALLLGCCGAPIRWTGDVKGEEEAHEKIKAYGEKAGKPAIVTTCPSCHKILKEALDEAEVMMVYDVPGFGSGNTSELPFEKASVFDPCSSRDYPQMQLKIRQQAKSLGLELEEPKYYGKESQCCSFGNHIYDVNRDMVEKQVKERIKDSDLPYVVYCSNCRDIFASKGKEVRHILDLILGINLEGKKVPTLQERRNNRYALKKELIEKYGISDIQGDIEELLPMDIDERIQKKMDDNLILAEDISAVIRNAEENKAYIVDGESGHKYAHLLKGIITYWAEYGDEDGSYKLFNVYSHRVSVKGEKAVSGS